MEDRDHGVDREAEAVQDNMAQEDNKAGVEVEVEGEVEA